MAKGDIVIPISSETKAFRQGVETGIIAPLDDAEEALDDLARNTGLTETGQDADKAADRLEQVRDAADKTDRSLDDLGRNNGPDKLEDAMRDAQDATEKLGDETKRTADAIEKEFRDSYRKVGDAGSDGMRKIGDGADEVRKEGFANLSESVSSFRGDLSDLGQVGQETLGGLASTLSDAGPAGIAGAAAIAAGAAGLGLITAEIEKENERVKKLKEYFSEAWQTAIEGGQDYLDTSTIIAEANDIRFNPDRADEYKKIQEDANKLGIDTNVLLRAAAGDQDKLNQIIARGHDLYEIKKDKVDGLTVATTAGAAITADNMRDEANDIRDLVGRYEQYGEINDENKRKATAASQLISEALLDEIDRAGKVGVEIDKVGNKLVHLPDGDVVIDAHTGKASRDVDKFKGDVDDKIDKLNGREVVLNARIGHIDDSAIRRFRPGTVSVPASIRVMNPIID